MELVREASIELYGHPLAIGLSSGTIECLRIGIEPDDVDRGIQRLEQYREVSRTAADFENTLTRLKIGLVE